VIDRTIASYRAKLRKIQEQLESLWDDCEATDEWSEYIDLEIEEQKILQELRKRWVFRR